MKEDLYIKVILKAYLIAVYVLDRIFINLQYLFLKLCC